LKKGGKGGQRVVGLLPIMQAVTRNVRGRGGRGEGENIVGLKRRGQLHPTHLHYFLDHKDPIQIDSGDTRKGLVT